MAIGVMATFNMTGKNRGDAKKKAFQDKRICRAIVDSVQQQHDCTEAAIKEQIGNVLKFAPFTSGARKERENETQNE